MLVSIVIPVLNEAQVIRTTAAALNGLRGHCEILVVDGGSTDDTVSLATSNGLPVIVASRGRGPQMNAGAAAAKGEALLFLHADTRLPQDALALIESALQAPDVSGGNFKLQFAGQTFGSQVLTRVYPLLRWLGLVYGDSAIFVRRDVFEEVGGYRAIPLFEDCDLYRRLRKKGRFICLPGIAVTSPRRFEGHFWRTFGLWVLLQILYWIGVNPRSLGWLYRVAR
jgi:rSAM/selenodomain-associated transferase 2